MPVTTNESIEVHQGQKVNLDSLNGKTVKSFSVIGNTAIILEFTDGTKMTVICVGASIYLE